MDQKIQDILGTINCLEVKEQEDGSALLTFDVNEEFKNNYVKLFNLTEWSQEHFEATLQEAIELSVAQHKLNKGE